MQRRALLVGLCIALATPACSKPKPPTLTPVSAKISKLTPTGPTLDVVLQAHNPNGFELSAQSVEATVTFGKNVTLKPITVTSGVSLPAGKSTPIKVSIAATWDDVSKVAGLALASPTVPYSVAGKVKIGSAKLNVELPFTLKGKVTRSEMLSAGIAGIPGLTSDPIIK